MSSRSSNGFGMPSAPVEEDRKHVLREAIPGHGTRALAMPRGA